MLIFTTFSLVQLLRKLRMVEVAKRREVIGQGVLRLIVRVGA